MISDVVAVAENYVIGKDGTLIWHYPTDLQHFKDTTSGGTKVMIMGRKTFESLPGVLPGRKHVVLTSQKDYKVDNPNVEVIHDISEIDPYIESPEESYLIGGGQLFDSLMDRTGRLYITWIEGSPEGDTYFPEIPKDEFKLVKEWEKTDEKTGVPLRFNIYDRIKKHDGKTYGGKEEE